MQRIRSFKTLSRRAAGHRATMSRDALQHKATFLWTVNNPTLTNKELHVASTLYRTSRRPKGAMVDA